ncbi:unnamed protein product [Caenorhabditis sp. 36 PRJEB53466]|nr:unnamed protein product [Caenorhabditis sp. 36 PRJEB53466]
MSLSGSPSSAASIDSDDSVPEVSVMTEKCAICGNRAFCYNYGVLTCNACKMFFRRVEVDKITYTCKFWNTCSDGLDGISAEKRCKACRFQRCLNAGMRYIAPGKPRLELKNRKDDGVHSLIGQLLYNDSRRRYKVLHLFTTEDPTLKEMIERSRDSRMVVKTTQLKTLPDIHEYSFFGIYTSIEHFLSLDFMYSLDTADKFVLLQHFAMKSMLLASALRTKCEGRDTIVTPNGDNVYPDSLYAKFSPDFLHRIRSLLVSRLTELRIRNEEHVLLNVILFCNPALCALSETARSSVAAQQKVYSSVLLQYCLLTYQQNGPSRFTDLLSLYDVINANFVDVHHLLVLFQFYMPDFKFKKVFADVMKN